MVNVLWSQQEQHDAGHTIHKGHDFPDIPAGQPGKNLGAQCYELAA